MKARDHRPEHIRPKMSTQNRAKQFAPFAALGSMEEILRQQEELPGQEDTCLERICETDGYKEDFLLRPDGPVV